MKVREEVELSCCCEAAGTEWTLVKSESCLFVFFLLLGCVWREGEL